jgi:hypothetical protein
MEAQVHLQNLSDRLAFFIEMRVVGAKSQQTLTPVLWDDNYISLPPHSDGSYAANFPAGQKAELKLAGWNVAFRK